MRVARWGRWLVGLADFHQLGVRKVAPCHCTGDLVRQMFADAFGTDCILAGVGQVIEVGSGEGLP